MSRQLMTMDGNQATAHVAYAFSEVAAIYPITPSSTMAEFVDEWAANNKKNLFGEEVKIVEMQSEGGAAGTLHGSIITGAYTSTFTASQGLLLMIPNMYKIAAEQTPAVFHVAARTVSSHALCIFGDHSDVMACRQTGVGMICSSSVQEAMDLAAVTHLAAIGGKLPLLHFFDGFRTSHEAQKIEVWDYEDLREMTDWDAVKNYRKKVFHPTNPYSMGAAEQPETYFQHREAANQVYTDTVEVVEKYMNKVNEKIGTNYKPFNYYGAEDATEVIIAMGSICEAAEEVVDLLNSQGKKVGLIKVRLYRPFSAERLVEAIPDTVKGIAVLDRTKEPGGMGEPLALDVIAAIKGTKFEKAKFAQGRYGLGSKDVQPGDIFAIYENLWADDYKPEFTVSIVDDVTNLSLTPSEYIDVEDENTKCCKFWGLGADGTVGASKNTVKIIGDNTDKHVQAYFQYDSKKSGGTTISHLRFGDKPIRSTYYIKQADFVACHVQNYIREYDIVEEIKPGGSFLLNCRWTDEQLEEKLPSKVKKYIAENNIKFYTCYATKIAEEVGLDSIRTNTVLQAAFFKIADIIPIEDATRLMKEAVKKTYSRKGEDIVKKNLAAIDEGIKQVHQVNVPNSWLDSEEDAPKPDLVGRDEKHTNYLNQVLRPVRAMKGDEVSVGKFLSTADGSVPAGTTIFEKRGISSQVPTWLSENCIQCNRCVSVCPQGVLRPFVMTEEEAKHEKEGAVKMIKGDGKYYGIRISARDCTGCALCQTVCPAKNKALKMEPAHVAMNPHQKEFDYAYKHYSDREVPFDDKTMKGVQFKKPYLEFSGACPGCGESPYAKLITQLFGDRMFIANATGCTSIWGCSLPSTPYTMDKNGRGPAWANSLFEDNAEFGLGMSLAITTRRNELKTAVQKLAERTKDGHLKEKANAWIEAMGDSKKAEETGNALVEECEKLDDEYSKYIVENKQMLIKPSIWLFGGDGWAYDIGYGGLDHVLALGEDVNVFVFDTEVYSNTGGQASKATPEGAMAKFAAAGKPVSKKDLARMAMSYGYVYVAKIAMGADFEQAIKAIKEAEAYPGPSIVVAYSPCINHGIRAGMNTTMDEMNHAVKCGYWNLYRYNPSLAAEGKNPFSLDSKPPTESYEDFLMREVRFKSLKSKFPEKAEKLFKEAEKDALNRYNLLAEFQKDLEPSDK